MRKIYTSLFLLGLLTQGWSAFSQQIPMSSLYKENRFLINPANAGYSEGLVGYLNYRNQWANVASSPTTGMLSLHSPLAKNSNIGTNIIYDRSDFVSTVQAMLAYAHDIKLATDHQLSLGVAFGVNHTQLNLSDAVVEDPNDPLLAYGNVTSTAFDLDAGFKYKWKGLEIGASAPHLLESLAEIKNKGKEFSYDLSRHFRFYAGYDLWIKDKWLIGPSAMVRWMPYKTNLSYDGTLKLGYKEIVWASFTWRAETGPMAALGVKIADKFTIAYAYDFTLSGLDGNPGSPWSNEIMIGFHLDGFKKRFEKLEDDLGKVQQDNISLNKKMDSLENVLGSKMDTLEIEVDVIKDDIDRLNGEVEDINDRMIDTNLLKGMLQRITPYRDEDGEIGMVKEQLESGYYVVIESFKSVENAWKGVEIWKKKDRNAIIVYNEERKWFYVYSTKFSDLKPALKEMRKTRKNGVPDAWVHKYRIDAEEPNK